MPALSVSINSAARSLPDRSPKRRVLLLIAGHTGQVGSALLKQLEQHAARTPQGVWLHSVMWANRREWRWLDPDHGGEHREPRRESDWPEILARFASLGHGARLLVDCTADVDLARHHREFLQRGIGVITANKLALAGSQSTYQALTQTVQGSEVPYACETTVGAALPVLGPVHDLAERGERVQRVEALVSGTLSFILHRVNNGARFSAAVREARARGYTEAHPAEDLRGKDSARKLLILLRTAGLHWEPEKIPVESLVPEDLTGESDAERFLTGLAAHDAAWAECAEAAHRRSLRLVYLARFDGRSASVGVTHVTNTDPFALLAPGENLVRLWTPRYQPVPLSIAGPGAGPELTAAGVLTDILKAANILL